MSVSIIVRTAVLGGTATSLDGVNGDLITEGMVAFVVDDGLGSLMYKASLTSAATPDGDVIVSPTVNAGTIRWIRGQIGWLDSMGGVFMHANLVKDPRLLPWFVAGENTIGPGAASDEYPNQPRWKPVVSPLSAAASWALVDLPGVIAQVAADNTYITVADVTGSGILANLFMPGVTNTGDIVSLRMTVDGVSHYLSFTAGAADDRFVCGDTRNAQPAGYGFDSAPYENMVWTGGGIVGGLATRLYSAGSGRSMVMNPSANLNGGSKCLRFESGLKIEMKVSDVSTANYRHYCGAVYYLHP